MIGRRAGASGRPGVCWRSSSSATSAISTNSRSRILLATLAGMAAAGLYGPGRATKGVETLVPPPDVAAAAAASRSRPAPGVRVVENTGTASSDPDGVIPASDNPVPVVERGTLN